MRGAVWSSRTSRVHNSLHTTGTIPSIENPVNRIAYAAIAGSTETVPLSQVVTDVVTEWEDPIIIRWDRRRAITVQASPAGDNTFPQLKTAVDQDFDKIASPLPVGYELYWDGEYSDTVEAQASLLPGVVPAIITILFIIVMLFNAFRTLLITTLTIPFASIGIARGLLATGAAFGFVALLGAMSLAGMMIKNSVVLLDQVNIELDEGASPHDAITRASVSRLRPVLLAAATTVLGVVPLMTDVFWVGMAVTIMAGLSFGTILTMLVVPTLYVMFFRIASPATSTYAAPKSTLPLDQGTANDRKI